METIRITEQEFNSIQPYTSQTSLKVFALFTGVEGLTMEIKSIEGTMNWLRDIIKELPFTISKDIISVLDKVFFINNK